VFFEKEERTLGAVISTPMRFWEYLAAKLILLVFISLIVAVVVATIGEGVSYRLVPLVLGVVLGTLMMLLVGIITSLPFDSVSDDEEEPDYGSVAHEHVGLGGPAQAIGHRQQHGQPDEAGEDGRVQEPLPHLQRQLEANGACQPGHDNRLPVVSTKTSSRLASLLWIVST
jgi:hypothetical protein